MLYGMQTSKARSNYQTAHSKMIIDVYQVCIPGMHQITYQMPRFRSAIKCSNSSTKRSNRCTTTVEAYKMGVAFDIPYLTSENNDRTTKQLTHKGLNSFCYIINTNTPHARSQKDDRILKQLNHMATYLHTI